MKTKGIEAVVIHKVLHLPRSGTGWAVGATAISLHISSLEGKGSKRKSDFRGADIVVAAEITSCNVNACELYLRRGVGDQEA